MLFIITKILSMNQESGRRASDKSRNDKLQGHLPGQFGQKIMSQER